MKRKIIFGLLFSTSSFLLKGATAVGFEHGYIIDMKGDTIKGEIKIPKKDVDLYKKVSLKISETETKNYSPEKVREYNMSGQVFISRGEKGEKAFLRRVSKGVINLCEYKFVEEDKEEYTDFFIQRAGEELYEILDERKFRKQLGDLMADNIEMAAKLKSKDLTFEMAVEFVQQYNDWKNKKSCTPKSNAKIKGEQLNRFPLTAGQKAEMKMVFYSGQKYELNICASDVLGKVAYKIIDGQRKVIFDSQQNDNPAKWEFYFQTTQELSIEVEAPKPISSKDKLATEYVSLAIGYIGQ